VGHEAGRMLFRNQGRNKVAAVARPLYLESAGLRIGIGPGQAAQPLEASSLWVRVASRPLREHRGVSEARTAEPASTRLERDGTGSGSRADINKKVER
jgi:hypothetical protein